MSTPPAGWDGILDEGETIQWQGRPGAGIIWRDLWHMQTFMGAFFCVFSALWLRGVYWMTGRMPPDMASGPMVLFPLVGSVFFLAGLYMLFGRLIWDAYVRSRSWYTLTNRAAYVATDIFGKRGLKRYARSAMIEPNLVDSDPGDVLFAREQRQFTSKSRRRNGLPSRPARTHVYYVPVGFRRIANPRAVYRLLIDPRYNDDTAES